MIRYIFFALPFLFITCTTSKVSYDVLIENVVFFDGFTDHGKVSLCISGDSIALISKDIRGISATDTIAGEGKYIIPGLVNSHVHLTQKEQLKEALENGIFAVIDLHKTSEKTAATLRQYRDSTNYAAFYSSGFAATLPGGHPTQFGEIETISDSITPEMFVQNRINNGADFIKVIRDAGGGPPDFEKLPTLSDDQIKKIIQTSHEFSKLCIAHTITLSETVDIAGYGIDGFAHLWFGNESVSEEQLVKLKNENIFIIPTALTQARIWNFVEQGPPPMQEYANKEMASMNLVQDQLNRINTTGIPILAGTDCPNFGINCSSDLLQELKIYANAGIPLQEVIQTVAGNPYNIFQLDHQGPLKQGDRANFLLLGSDPQQNIEALQDIEGIWKNGKRVK